MARTIKHHVDVQTVRSGQPRPYADTETVYIASFTWSAHNTGEAGPTIKPHEIEQKQAVETVSALMGFLKVKDSKDWHLPTLKKVEKTAVGVFQFLITEEYTG